MRQTKTGGVPGRVDESRSAAIDADPAALRGSSLRDAGGVIQSAGAPAGATTTSETQRQSTDHAAGRSESAGPGSDRPRTVTLRTLQKMAAKKEPFACLTCYDVTTARWLERAGVEILLVGDTAAEMILGLPGTIHAPLDFLLTITAAVKRGAPNTFVMGDMPFMSYQADEAEAIRNAGRFMTDGMADAVKFEADKSYAPLLGRIARAGIPVVGHVGSKPQWSKQAGGYRSVGKKSAEAIRLVEDAKALEDAGAVMLLIEAAPNEVSKRIVEETSVPVISCGAGTACHGQIVVLQDLLGLSDWQPAFAQPLVQMGLHMQATAEEWVRRVRTGNLGEHPYQMADDERAAFERSFDSHGH